MADVDIDKLDWKDVLSSNVRRAAWQDNGLYVEFQNGGVYRYHGPPEDTLDALREAASPGRFIRSNIVPVYDCERVG